MAWWRLTLDVPFSFCIEQGFARDVKSCDFRIEKSAGTGFSPRLWREPILGIVMLKPSVLQRGFTTDFKGLGTWNYRAAFWNEVRRGQAIKNFPNPAPNADPDQPFALLMAPVKPAGQRYELIELLIQEAIMAIKFDVLWKENYDDMKWVMQSTFTLAEDESYAIHYHGLTDEMVRKENWFCFRVDTLGIHFSHTGIMRVYQYDRADLTKPPIFLQEVQMCHPGDILNRSGYFYFIPIPNVGLAVYHSLQPKKADIFGASARNVAVTGKLIPWSTSYDGTHAYLFQASNVSIGMNPYHPTLIGFQVVRFPTTAEDFNDGPFSIPYKPTLAPSSVTASGVADRGTLSAVLQAAAGGALWDPTASDSHLARVAITLQTGDAKYTPFCGTYSVRWLPVFATRATTALPLAYHTTDGVDRLERLEWSDNADSHFEGEAQILIYSIAGQVIMFRGDATFLLEYSQDQGTTWFTYTGGFAKQWIVDVEYSPNWGTYYRCKVRLYDMWERGEETHVLWQMAFDSLAIGRALNNVLTGMGFSVIADADLPAEALTTTLQFAPDGLSWRYSPREGEKYQDVIALLLLYLRKQNVQYRLRFNWAGTPPAWILELRPRDIATIVSLVPFAASRNEGAGIWDYSSCRMMPEPPEGNIIICEGLTVPDPQHALRVTVPPLVNTGSLSDPTSPDYLGRSLIVKINVPEVTDNDTLTKMARRFYDAIAHRRLKANIETQHFTWILAPNVRIQVYRTEGSLMLDTWIKRRTVVIENFDQEVVKFDTDTIWEEPIGRA